MPRSHPSGSVLPDRVPGHRPEPESLPYAYLDGKAANSFNPALERAVAPQPLAAILAHQGDNAVADLKEALFKDGMLLRRDEFFGQQLSAGFHRDRDRLQRPL